MMAAEFKLQLLDLAAMDQLCEALAKRVRIGDIITLSGTLGAGKTTLARAIIHGLGYVDEVPSPSFAIVQYYDPPEIRIPLLHADFYRLNDPQEMAELGLEEQLDQAVLIAEWPEYGLDLSGENCLSLQITIAQNGARVITAQYGTGWQQRQAEIIQIMKSG